MMRNKRSTKRSKSPKDRLIALLTDFGTSDHYAGTVKGVILSINPKVHIVDISHDVRPYNVQEASYLLWASYRYFPEKTIFVNIVDPGVGSNRKIICIETAHHTFIAPDNGLLDFIILEEDIRSAYEIFEAPQFRQKRVSPTFHGRNIFAPLAAYLSLGKPLRRYGKIVKIRKPQQLLYEPESGYRIVRILHIDRFGNIVTNIPERYFEQCTLGIGRAKISKRIRTFAEAPTDQPCLIVGSSGLIEVVLKEKSAAETLGAELGTAVTALNISCEPYS